MNWLNCLQPAQLSELLCDSPFPTFVIPPHSQISAITLDGKLLASSLGRDTIYQCVTKSNANFILPYQNHSAF